MTISLREKNDDRLQVVLFGATVFVSAFLLFQVQPLIARYILPWFGGSASVWSTSLLFFQVALLVGYGYAHLIVTRLRLRTQVILHVALVSVALVVLPIVPSDAFRPDGGGSPTLGVLILLAVTVGPLHRACLDGPAHASLVRSNP